MATPESMVNEPSDEHINKFIGQAMTYCVAVKELGCMSTIALNEQRKMVALCFGERIGPKPEYLPKK